MVGDVAHAVPVGAQLNRMTGNSGRLLDRDVNSVCMPWSRELQNDISA